MFSYKKSVEKKKIKILAQFWCDAMDGNSKKNLAYTTDYVEYCKGKFEGALEILNWSYDRDDNYNLLIMNTRKKIIMTI